MNRIGGSGGVHERAMLVQRTLTGWSGRRYDREESRRLTSSCHASDDAARVNKLVVPKSLLSPIERHDGEWQRWHESMTLPYPVRGIAILTGAAYFDYAGGTATRRDERERLVGELAERLPQALADAPRRLGTLLKPGDLPTVEEVIGRYRADVVFLPFPQTSAIAALIDDDDALAATGKFIDSTVEAAMEDVWTRVSGAVERLLERVEAREADESAKLYASVVDNIRELVDVLPKLNLTGDARLDEVRRSLERRLGAYTIEELRDDGAARRQAAGEAERLLESMKEWGYAA